MGGCQSSVCGMQTQPGPAPAVASQQSEPRGTALSAHDDAEAAVEAVLPVVEEGAQGQGDRQGWQLLLQDTPHAPVAVHETCKRDEGP